MGCGSSTQPVDQPAQASTAPRQVSIANLREPTLPTGRVASVRALPSAAVSTKSTAAPSSGVVDITLPTDNSYARQSIRPFANLNENELNPVEAIQVASDAAPVETADENHQAVEAEIEPQVTEIQEQPPRLLTANASFVDNDLINYGQFLQIDEVVDRLDKNYMKRSMLFDVFHGIDEDGDGLVNRKEYQDIIDLLDLTHQSNEKKRTQESFTGEINMADRYEYGANYGTPVQDRRPPINNYMYPPSGLQSEIDNDSIVSAQMAAYNEHSKNHKNRNSMQYPPVNNHYGDSSSHISQISSYDSYQHPGGADPGYPTYEANYHVPPSHRPPHGYPPPGPPGPPLNYNNGYNDPRGHLQDYYSPGSYDAYHPPPSEYGMAPHYGSGSMSDGSYHGGLPTYELPPFENGYPVPRNELPPFDNGRPIPRNEPPPYSGIAHTPPPKRGFLVHTKSGRMQVSEDTALRRATSKFFTLDKGILSYMDSTSKTPPISLDNREVLLRNAQVIVRGSTLDICTEQDGDIISLEVKSFQERDDWVDAINQHIEFTRGGLNGNSWQ